MWEKIRQKSKIVAHAITCNAAQKWCAITPPVVFSPFDYRRGAFSAPYRGYAVEAEFLVWPTHRRDVSTSFGVNFQSI